MTPLAIDLFCGLGGWSEGLLAEGYDCIGFDIERHDYGTGGYPAQLVLQDVLTLHGRQFKDASLIVASPPCQEYSYMAMPWSRAKQIAGAFRGERDFPVDYRGSRTVSELTALFDACFRIQREAIEAAGHHIPLVVENVRGAIPWVGRSRWNYGSFHLWGDVPALMPMTKAVQKFNPDGSAHPPGSWFAIADSKNRGSKNNGGSWFNIGSPGKKETNRNPVHEGVKTHVNKRDGHGHTRHLTNQAESDAIKNGGDWFSSGEDCSLQRRQGSKSTARKAASAAIAKIPLPLARHIARAWMPNDAPNRVAGYGLFESRST